MAEPPNAKITALVCSGRKRLKVSQGVYPETPPFLVVFADYDTALIALAAIGLMALIILLELFVIQRMRIGEAVKLGEAV